MASELNGSELKVMISIMPKMVDGEYHDIKNTYISETIGITYSIVGRSLSVLVNKGYLIRENSTSRRYRFDLDTMADKVNNWVIVDE
jgi:DNA-binding MarR family transcriptional regulator